MEHWTSYPWLLDICEYIDESHLVENIESMILNPVEDWNNNKDRKINDTIKNEEISNENEALSNENEALSNENEALKKRNEDLEKMVAINQMNNPK